MCSMLFMLFLWHADVPVEVIANFNKMKSFTEDRALVIRAMKNSSLLEVWVLFVCVCCACVRVCVWVCVVMIDNIKYVHNVPAYTGYFHFKVSSDEQFVRRATPLSEPSYVDERTLYVVSLTTKHTTVDMERFTGLNIHGFSHMKFFTEILSRCIGHQCLLPKIHKKTFTVSSKTVKV